MDIAETVIPILIIAGITLTSSLLFRASARNNVPRWIQAAFHLLNAAGAVFFILHFIISDRDAGMVKFIARYSYLWMYITCNGVMTAIVMEALRAVAGRFGFRIGRKACLAVTTAAVAVLMIVGHINYVCIRTVSLPQQKEGFGESMRIVFASDIHLGEGIGARRLKIFTDRINSLNPDVVILGGDLLDKGAVVPEADNCPAVLREIKARYGVYGIYGNHEYYAPDTAKVAAFYRNSGITVLRDSSVCIGGKVLVSGMDDEGNPKADRHFPENEAAGDSIMFRIGISHRPGNLNRFDACGYDLSLCGHTHNGQFFPGNLLLRLERKHSGEGGYTYGKYLLPHGSEGYVSCGLGIWGPHFRTFSRSEIVVVDIKQQI